MLALRTFPLAALLLSLVLLAGRVAPVDAGLDAQTPTDFDDPRAELRARFLADQEPARAMEPLAYTPCVGGIAGIYPCSNVDLVAFLPNSTIGSGQVVVLDVTNKAAPALISSRSYAGSGYIHQGWLTEDHRYFYLDDELDEMNFAHNTKTYVWDVADLDCSCQVDALDISQAAQSWNCGLGDACYRSRADRDRDGLVTVADLMQFSSQWGWTCPTP